jgi:3-methyladenine DNA glycosylase AlkD
VTTTSEQVHEAVAWLERKGSKRVRDEQLTRYGITARKAFGVPVGTIQQLAKRLGSDQELAVALWKTGWYEARLLTAFVAQPERLTAAQMDRWTKDFDNWGVCDTLCFKLYDRTPHAWSRIEKWSVQRAEFVKRAGFALLASVALHDKTADDERFLQSLMLIERGAIDERHLVKKGVSWALRSVGRRNPALNVASVELSRRLAESTNAAARSVGKESLRELTGATVRRALAARRRSTKA